MIVCNILYAFDEIVCSDSEALISRCSYSLL